MSTTTLDPTITVAEIEVFADNLNVAQAAATYKEHGCLVVRGLMAPYIDAMYRDIMTTVDTAIGQLDEARQIPEGWVTPNGCLFIPAPENYNRDKQIMTVGVSQDHPRF